MPIIEVHNLQEFEDLIYYQTLRELKGPKEGYFIADGVKVVESLLNSSIQVESLFLTPEHFENLNLLNETKVYLASKEKMQEVVGRRLHQGAMAMGKIPSMTDQWKPPFLVLHDLKQSENMGTIIRSFVALTKGTLLVSCDGVHPYLRRCVRSSMGTVFKQPYIMYSSLKSLLSKLKEMGVQTLGTSPHRGEDLSQFKLLNKNFALFMGEEGEGLCDLESFDQLLSLPMKNEVDSLNVAAATSIFLYELCQT